jgi:hypothetical protein
MAIEGVKEEPAPEPAPATPTIVEADPVPARPTVARPEEDAGATETPEPPSSTNSIAPATSAVAAEEDAKPTAQGSPMENNDNECHLLGPYALFVQGALGILAVTSLVIKRWRESPRRPIKIWWFDVSKQVFGSALLHLSNILLSMLSSGKFDVATTRPANNDGEQPNPCSFYLLNITIDVSEAHFS